MIFQIDFKSGKPVYLQLVDQIRYAAASGGLRTGEPLPSIRPLAEELLFGKLAGGGSVRVTLAKDGEGLALDVVAAQSQLAQARGNYFSAISAYLNARADFEVASGQ